MYFGFEIQKAYYVRNWLSWKLKYFFIDWLGQMPPRATDAEKFLVWS